MGITHVHGGRLLLSRIAEAGLAGERLEWCDVLCDGPTPAGLDGAAWYAARGSFLAETAGADSGLPYAERLAAQDSALAAAARRGELVLWFGPELFCQAILVYLLAWFRRTEMTDQVSLVTPGDVPERPGCSASLMPLEEIEPAFGARHLVRTRELDLATRAWTALTASDPTGVAALLQEDTSALPYLRDALRRHLEELPDTSGGLSRSERALLEAVAAGATSSQEAYRQVQARETRPWMTDLLFLAMARRLASGDAPLVALSEDRVELTPRARAVLAGRDRWVARRWRGGVRIDADCPWRWDRAAGRLAQG